jgi:hypothetical protein
MVRKSSFVIGLVSRCSGDRARPESSRDDAVVQTRSRDRRVRDRGAVDEVGSTNPANAFGPGLLGLGLAVLWIVGVASHEPGWVSWLNFLFGSRASRSRRWRWSGRQIHIHGPQP